MKAVTVAPLNKDSIKIISVNEPAIESEDEVLVKVIDAGVCRTDIEIRDGLYGEAPRGCDYLILGHESLGLVESVGKNVKSLSIGDYVVRTVRRKCVDNCVNCKKSLIDMCTTGNYSEVGIKGLHGVMVEKYVDKEEYLVKIPVEHADVGVLLEPLSVVEKAVCQAYKIQERLVWQPQRALVLGAGPIGLLQAFITRLEGWDTYVIAKSKKGNLKSQIVEEIGAKYISTYEKDINEVLKGFRPFDFILEATGVAHVIPSAWRVLNNNGVFCLSSITGGRNTVPFPINEINLETVLGNKILFGTVNSNKQDYRRGVKRFSQIKAKWSGLLEQLITKRLSIEGFSEGFVFGGSDIKSVIQF